MGSRRATDCIAGDKPVDADSPAPGRRVRDLPTAGVPAAGAGLRRTFCLSNLFSFVAQAATGIPLLVPSRGFVPGLRVLSPAAFSRTFAPIACLPVLRCLCGFSLSCFFALSCLTFSSQTSFHLSLRPRRASTFFRKESRQRFAKGLRPFEPHSSALRPISPFPALLAGLRGPLGRKPPADGETLEKAKEQSSAFSSVSVRRRTPAPFRCSPPFSGCWPA